MTVTNETPLANCQDAYDRIRTAFSKTDAQLAKSDVDSSGAGNCFYRHPEDNRGCAIGCLLPDTLYRERFEGYGCLELEDKADDGDEPLLAKELRIFFGDDPRLPKFLSCAQGAHDTAHTVGEFIINLDHAAGAEGLSVPA